MRGSFSTGAGVGGVLSACCFGSDFQQNLVDMTFVWGCRAYSTLCPVGVTMRRDEADAKRSESRAVPKQDENMHGCVCVDIYTDIWEHIQT